MGQHLCIHGTRLTPANAHLDAFDEERLCALLGHAGLRSTRCLCLTNKLLELSGFPERSRGWPHACWRAVDRLLNTLTGKSAFLLVVGERPR